MTLTDHETTVLDHLDVEIPCDHSRCDAAAEWVERWHGLRCCVPVGLVCSDCLERAREWLRTRQRRPLYRVRCNTHGVTSSVGDCRIDAEPLNPS
ncbi:hypothetical protein GCM10008944_01460 [Cytobacillus oceanisediminis]